MQRLNVRAIAPVAALALLVGLVTLAVVLLSGGHGSVVLASTTTTPTATPVPVDLTGVYCIDGYLANPKVIPTPSPTPGKGTPAPANYTRAVKYLVRLERDNRNPQGWDITLASVIGQDTNSDGVPDTNATTEACEDPAKGDGNTVPAGSFIADTGLLSRPSTTAGWCMPMRRWMGTRAWRTSGILA